MKGQASLSFYWGLGYNCILYFFDPRFISVSWTTEKKAKDCVLYFGEPKDMKSSGRPRSWNRNRSVCLFPAVGTLAEEWALEGRGRRFSLQGGGRSGLTGDLYVCLRSCFSGMKDRQRSDPVYHDFDFFKLEWLFPAQTQRAFTQLCTSWGVSSFGKSQVSVSPRVQLPWTVRPTPASLSPPGKLLLWIPLWRWVHRNALASGPTWPKAAETAYIKFRPGWEPASSASARAESSPLPPSWLCLNISKLTSLPF